MSKTISNSSLLGEIRKELQKDTFSQKSHAQLIKSTIRISLKESDCHQSYGPQRIPFSLSDILNKYGKTSTYLDTKDGLSHFDVTENTSAWS